MMALRTILLTLLSLALPALAYTGAQACATCHATEYTHWQGSHHDLAMQVPGPDTVLGNFDNAEFNYNGIRTRFFREGDKYIVRTDGEDGKVADFEVAYVFGVYPLQQYLLPLSRGRLQALSIAWDARPAAAGGQRWYHLHPEDDIDYSDPLHWTGPYYNWNSRCAECHSTDLQKNFSASNNAYTTTFAEIDVSCEACHGPGEKHVSLATSGALSDAKDSGFAIDLRQRGIWTMPDGKPVAQRTKALDGNTQIDTCGRCHSRRGTLGNYHYGADLLDTHRLSLPRAPLYYPDGQIRDEVYVYGSFLQSKMHRAGVVCSNCHDPHSLQLRAPGNAVCAQCHAPATFDTPDHHHHTAGSAGAECVACHMPEQTYMGVDPRRDHSLRIPRPDLSLVIGVPNACNQCHQDKKADWSLRALRQWGVTFRDTARHPARAFHNLARGDTRAVTTLAQLANDPLSAPIWRASAMDGLGETGSREALQAGNALLQHDDPLLRASAVRALAFLPPQHRLQLLAPLLEDKILAVRMDVALALAPVPLNQLPPQQAHALEALFTEYESVQALHADMPETHVQLGIFRAERGDYAGAEQSYRQAIRLNAQLVPAYLNLADLMRGQQRDDEARALLQRVLAFAPDNGPTLHVLGLLETRSGNKTLALDYLGRAAAAETEGSRHRFVYAIALHDLGEPARAIAQLQALLRVVPQSQQVLQALTDYSAEAGQREQALRYARRLAATAPDNRNYQQLVERLSR